MNPRNRGRWMVFLAGVLWSFGGLLVKSVHASAPTIAFYRSLFAALALLPFLRKSDLAFPKDRNLLLAILAYTGVMGCFVTATQKTYAANAIILQYTAPLFVLLLSGGVLRRYFYGEGAGAPPAWERRDLFLLCGCMAGILMIFFGQARGAQGEGIGIAVLSGFWFAVYMVSSENLKGMSPLALVFAVNAASALLTAAFAEVGYRLGRGDLALLMVSGFFQLGLPYALFTRGLQTVPAREASLLVMSEPVLNPLWVALALGEIPPWTTWAGGACILAALASRYLLF